MKQCLWCGNEYTEGMDGICRSCWEKNQFSAGEDEVVVDDKLYNSRGPEE
jgi:hypothetical protein